MARAKLPPEILAHLEWLGFVQPTGLVVSAPALVKANAILDRRDVQGQMLLKECVAERTGVAAEEPESYNVPDFETFARRVLGWGFSPKYYAGTTESPMPSELEIALPEYGDTLRADYAVREPDRKEGGSSWQLLVRVLEPDQDIDRVTRGSGRLEASEHSRMERLLRQTGVLAGLISNGERIRLISAPRGESSGWLDFQVPYMLTTAGRPICAALRLLLGENRLLGVSRQERLTALLEDSRKYQNEVSERLAEQVLHALYELLRGFQAADDARRGELLREQLRERPDEVYHALLTVLLRLVFILYAEERDMLPEDETFVRHYSIASLHERLRGDAALYPDTMDQRFGAWAQLLTLFRMVHDGASAKGMHLPERHGVLFDPNRFPFLEGRPSAGARQIHERIDPPLVSDGTIFRVLEKLLVLDGERISYRALDVEQIGSVYETMMGFRLETAPGRSLAIRPAKRLGAPVTIDLEELLTIAPDKREKWLVERTDRKPAAGVKQAIITAAGLEELHAALDSLVDRDATPDIVPPGSMVLQPSEERRRSGSHYTPRQLTGPIVRTTLEPVLARLKGQNGEPPRPEQILDLKVCDPAMGSGAFLVESCRQLADALLESWDYHDLKPVLPPDEDEVIFARRLVTQRCLYGVDRNPVAVDLAKMSLWLATLARDHPLTFLDHALKHGDSLVGLWLHQIEGFHWVEKEARARQGFVALKTRGHLERALDLRALIQQAGDDTPEPELKELLRAAEDELAQIKLAGDLVVASFFFGTRTREREARLAEFANVFSGGRAEDQSGLLDALHHTEPPLVPFHWGIEFPEVFQRDNAGFDAVVGNPPFLGGRRISSVYGIPYSQFLRETYPPAGNTCDLVAYFFRRSFALLKEGACLGLLATNTISQGDTRDGGLAPIRRAGGWIYHAQKRIKWPGTATVIVSLVCIAKGMRPASQLEGRMVDRITAFLFHSGGDDSPKRLAGLAALFSTGSKIYGQGFLFDDEDPDANPTSLMVEILSRESASKSRVIPYIGGEELNGGPLHCPQRHVIYLSDLRTEEEAESFPGLLEVVKNRVKPYRDSLGDNPVNTPLRRRWWAYQAHRPQFYESIANMPRILAISEVSRFYALAFLPIGMIYAHTLILFAVHSHAAFCSLQSQVHETWARFVSSSLGDALRYTGSDCFETFPFAHGWQIDPVLEAVGKDYYEFRAALMVRNDEGLTKTYNRFHDPDEDSADILRLRDLHEAMDRAMLDVYGWTDIPTACEFLLDYEEDEEEASARRKPWRYRWPDDVRDEVLARLLELNAQRAAEEALVSAAANRRGGGRRSSSRERNPDAESLF